MTDESFVGSKDKSSYMEGVTDAMNERSYARLERESMNLVLAIGREIEKGTSPDEIRIHILRQMGGVDRDGFVLTVYQSAQYLEKLQADGGTV